MARSQGADERGAAAIDVAAAPTCPRTPAEVVHGLLLCGGASRRMGRDKALLPMGGRALIEYPLQVLRQVSSTVWLASGAGPRYAELGAPCVVDPIADGGPLAGLVAGLEAAARAGAQWVVVLACDMPAADARTLSALLELARREDADACLLELARGSQPTFAAYHVRCAQPARRALEFGERRLVSFHGGFGARGPLRVVRLAAACIGAEHRARNVNTPQEFADELAGARNPLSEALR